MAAKWRIIYEDEDDDGNSNAGNDCGSLSSKRSCRASDETEIQPAEVPATEPSSIQRSTHSGKGKQINPMAPSSQDAREQGSHCWQVNSNSPNMISLQSHAPPRSPQPVFSLAVAGQGFSFRILDIPSQAHMSAGTAAQTQAPPCAQFHGVVASETSILQMFQFEDFNEQNADPPLSDCTTRLQHTTSFYDVPLTIKKNCHSITTVPRAHDDRDELQIDEASPSEDDRYRALILSPAIHSIAEARSDLIPSTLGNKGLSRASCELPGNLATATQEAEDIYAATSNQAAADFVPAKLQENLSATETAIHGHGVSDMDKTKPVGPATEGWWPHHASGITRLLWEDLGNWHSGLRKKAHLFIAQCYQWDPENCHEQNIKIARHLLGSGSLFLKNGVDDEGHANNLTHLVLMGLIINFFYSGSTSVSQLFPEVFSLEVPRVAMAIAATAICLSYTTD
ncbi:hypothetical protein EDC04DRAFT_2612981 [Pisolithus marmoratus]|nr:hypothetical protein EDC04DRAFT_2612981 [Pisolithus marmoratus]